MQDFSAAIRSETALKSLSFMIPFPRGPDQCLVCLKISHV